VDGADPRPGTRVGMQMIINSGTFTAKKPWTLSLSCSHDTTISTGSHWDVFFNGPILAVQQGPIQSTVS
jgi:hypothetical protein